MKVTRDFTVAARGVGRKDYSSATEKSVEPVISSWQSGYLYRGAVVVPALGSLTTDIEVELDQVVIIYDFFASIPSNRLIRLIVQAVGEDGAVLDVLDKTSYQTVVAHILKGVEFFKIIRFITYNYADVDEDMRIGCSGMYTSLTEYLLYIAEV